jgi:hypothetical protein
VKADGTNPDGGTSRSSSSAAPAMALWARSGHEAPSRIVYRTLRYALTRGFTFLGQACRPQHANACAHGSRNGPSPGLLWG